MPTAKVTWFFEDAEGYGWSESLYHDYTTSLDEISEAADRYFTARLTLCADGIEGLYQRISDDSIRGDALVNIANYQVGSGAGNAPSTGGNQKTPKTVKGASPGAPATGPNDCLTVRFQIGTTYHAIKYFRGLSTQVLTSPPGPTISGDWETAWKAYIKRVLQDSWKLKVQLRAGQNEQVAIQTVTAGPPTVFTAAGHHCVVGSVVRIGGFRGIQLVRTKGVVSVVAGNTFQIQGYASPLSINTPNIGYVQVLQPGYLGITSVQADEQAYRKPGRPFGLRPGRRKAKAQ